jgi:hypothetical protein
MKFDAVLFQPKWYVFNFGALTLECYAGAGLTRDDANARLGSRERIARLLCAPSDAPDMAPAWMGSACVTLAGTVMIVQTRIAPATARDTAPVRCAARLICLSLRVS